MIGHLGASPKITNVICVDNSVEYMHTFEKYVKKLLVQPRNFKDLRVAFKPGETLTNYISLVSGSPWWEDNIIGPITVYFKAEENNVVVEILEWKSID